MTCSGPSKKSTSWNKSHAPIGLLVLENFHLGFHVSVMAYIRGLARIPRIGMFTRGSRWGVLKLYHNHSVKVCKQSPFLFFQPAWCCTVPGYLRSLPLYCTQVGTYCMWNFCMDMRLLKKGFLFTFPPFFLRVISIGLEDKGRAGAFEREFGTNGTKWERMKQIKWAKCFFFFFFVGFVGQLSYRCLDFFYLWLSFLFNIFIIFPFFRKENLEIVIQKLPVYSIPR